MQGIGHEYFFARGQLLKMESNHGVMVFEKSSTFWDTSDIATIGSNLELLKINNQTTARSGDKVIIKGIRAGTLGQIDNVTIYKNYFQPLGVDWEMGLLLILGILSLIPLIVYKKFSKSNVLILTPLIIVVIIFVIVSYFFLQNQQLQNVQKEMSIMTPTTVAKSGTANWKAYADKEIIENSGLYLKIPSGWIIKYRKTDKLSQDYNANFRIEFDFSPPGWKTPPQSVDWMGWRIMNIDVYGTKTNINQWMTDYLPKYKNGLTVSETKTIGNKTAYLISASSSSEFFAGWIPRYIILGKDYSYELGFNNNGEPDAGKIIEKDIYPNIYFN